MLKLPKGLKKKKKKSKKDQELFTEEELEQYKRELQLKQQQHQEQENSNLPDSVAPETENTNSEPNTSAASSAAVVPEVKNTSEEDEEWSKFKVLTAGVDSILHKTQDELDRIKSTSFYQRLPTEVEKKKLEEEEAAAREAKRLEEETKKKQEEEANRDKLAEAVVELSDTDEESEEVDDIFETSYIDAITSGEIQLTVIPDSPDLELDLGPDPFDTSYADTVVKGPEVSKRGKKLVSLGSAVEVLTGRVDSAQALALSGAKKKPRKGITNLLLEDEADLVNFPEELAVTPEPVKTLLDDLADDIPDVPIDLSISLHLTLLQQKREQDGDDQINKENEEQNFNTAQADIVSEFDVLKNEEDDEFAELAAESLIKKEEIKVLTQQQPSGVTVFESNWAEFEITEEEKQQKVKPPRPPPARPAFGPHIKSSAPPVELDSDDEFAIPEDDPFDTDFVEKVIVVKEEDDDFDFDPRAGEEKQEVKKVTQKELFGEISRINTTSNLLPVLQKDLLAGSNTDLSALPIAPVQESFDLPEDDFDPFDTSAVLKAVEPKEVELKLLEKDLLADSKLKHSLSDPDFDPRAEEEKIQELPEPQIVSAASIDFDTARRKSSLSLAIPSKSVGFLVPDNDLLVVDHETGKIQKPLTPYYAAPEAIEEKEVEDPFDTSFVPKTVPTEIELKNLEKDLLTNTTLKHSLSDPDFDPRADDIKKIQPEVKVQSDLLAVEDHINIKVLTPALESKEFLEEGNIELDPFDTSIASNIQPGKTELKLLENELLPQTKPEITTGVLDTLSDAQELGLGDKVLTPQIPVAACDSIEEIDPFDTSFAANLAPGQTEIKLIETELIEK